MNRLPSRLPVIVFLLAVLAGACRPGDTALDPPTPAPDFTLPALADGPFRLADHRGKVIVLNFWATWCAPCRADIPDFVALQRELRDEGVLFVGVSLDQEGAPVVEPFAREYAINYPVVLDPAQTLAEPYGGFGGLPTTFLLDREGRIRYRVLGIMPRESLVPRLRTLLAETPPAAALDPVPASP